MAAVPTIAEALTTATTKCTETKTAAEKKITDAGKTATEEETKAITAAFDTCVQEATAVAYWAAVAKAPAAGGKIT